MQPKQDQQQQQEWQPVTDTTALRDLFAGIGHGLWNAPRDIWQVGIVQGTRDVRAFLAHPPRWFVVATVVGVVCVMLFFACALSGAVAEQARWLRSLMP